MPTKKKIAKKAAPKKTIIEKVSDTAAHLKDEIIAGKDHVIEFAGEAFDSIKEGVKHLVQKKKPKKVANKKLAKKVTPKKLIKKATPKKTIKKVAVKKATKKTAPKKTARKR